MYTELELYDKDIKIEDLNKQVYNAIDAGIGGFASTPYLLPYVKDLVPYGYVLSCPVDYPYGTSDITVRSHAILSAFARGADSIDLVVNFQAANNKKYDIIHRDLEAQSKICAERNKSLRIMMDYRCTDYETFLDVKKLLIQHNIEYVLPSTGAFLDNMIDNIVFGKVIELHSTINVISNGQVPSVKDYKEILAKNPFGIRFKSYHIMKMCLGV